MNDELREGAPQTGSPPPPHSSGADPLLEDLEARLLRTAQLCRDADAVREPPERENIQRELAAALMDLQRRVPRGAPVFDDALALLDRAPDPMERAEALATELWPAHVVVVETMRSQRAFNQQFRAVARDVLTQVAAARHGDVGAWVLQSLSPHIDPLVPRIETHRAGRGAQLVVAAKSAALAAARPVLHRWGKAQRAWNEHAMRLLAQPADSGDSGLRLLGQLGTELSAHIGRLPASWRPVFLEQLAFCRAAESVLGRQLGGESSSFRSSYQAWCAEQEATAVSRWLRGVGTGARPELTVVVAADGTPEELRQTLRSIFGQTVVPPEVVVVAASEALRAELSTLTPPEGCSLVERWCEAETGTAALLATGLTHARTVWVTFVECGATLAPFAVEAIAAAMRREPSAGLVFSDEDFLENGERVRPYFKPSFSRIAALETDEVTRLMTVRRDKCAEAGGIRTGAGGAALYDLALRVTQAGTAARIPLVLCHRTRARPLSQPEVAFALAPHLPEGASVEGAQAGWSVRRKVRGAPLVTMIVPFRDKPELTSQLLRSLQRHDAGVRYEVLLLDNGSRELETARMVREFASDQIRSLRWDHPFNYSALNNFGARHAKGEYLLFLNNDVEATHRGWLAEMVALAQDEEVGAVGARLLFPDQRLQHAGVVLGPGGMAAHPFWRLPRDAPWTPFGTPRTVREYLAVTAACLLLRRSHFEAVGGFDEQLVVSGNDVDLCLRLHERGLHNLFTPRAELIHHESATRRLTAVRPLDGWNSFTAFSKWLLRGDPFYHPNLTLTAADNTPRLDRRDALVLSAQMLLFDLPPVTP